MTARAPRIGRNHRSHSLHAGVSKRKQKARARDPCNNRAAVSLISACQASLQELALAQELRHERHAARHAGTSARPQSQEFVAARASRHAFMAFSFGRADRVPLPKVCKYARRRWGCFFQPQAKMAGLGGFVRLARRTRTVVNLRVEWNTNEHDSYFVCDGLVEHGPREMWQRLDYYKRHGWSALTGGKLRLQADVHQHQRLDYCVQHQQIQTPR